MAGSLVDWCSILDDKGELLDEVDALENVNIVEQRNRTKLLQGACVAPTLPKTPIGPIVWWVCGIRELVRLSDRTLLGRAGV
jgi:hypothetical protein